MSPTCFASQLRLLRRKMHWTQLNVASLMGVSPITVYRWERGLTYPSAYARSRLCEVAGVEVEELFAEPLSPSMNDVSTSTVLKEETSLAEERVPSEHTSLLQETVRLKRLEVLLHSLECAQAIGIQLAEMKQGGLLSEQMNGYALELFDVLISMPRGEGV